MLPQQIICEDVLSNPGDFFAALGSAQEKEITTLIGDSTIKELMLLSQTEFFERFLNAIGTSGVNVLQRKLNPSGTPFKPGEKSKYAIVSVSNLRYRCTFQLILVAMIAFLYRALEERSSSRFNYQFMETFDESERKTIRRFLDAIFEYNPTEHIDRITSEIYTPDQSKHKTVNSKTHKIDIKSRDTRITNSAAKNPQERIKTVARTSAVMKDAKTGNEITIDPPVDFYGRFLTYYNAHFDAIYKTSFELFFEQRISAHTTGENLPKFYREEVSMQTFDPAKPDEPGTEIATFKLPSPNQQWNLSAMVYSPPDGRFFDTPEDAEKHLMKIKGLAINDLKIIPTNSTVLLDSWAAGNKRVLVDDQYARAILAKQEENAKLYANLNKERAKKAQLINMIEQGPDKGDFHEYLSSLSPAGVKANTLDEYDEEELMDRYREFQAKNHVYPNSDQGFMDFVQRSLPNRDLNRNPITMDERKKYSALYRSNVLMSEVHADELMGLDIYELGGPDAENPRAEHRREYVRGAETNLH